MDGGPTEIYEFNPNSFETNLIFIFPSALETRAEKRIIREFRFEFKGDKNCHKILFFYEI